jgi:hypothetical protein
VVRGDQRRERRLRQERDTGSAHAGEPWETIMTLRQWYPFTPGLNKAVFDYKVSITDHI